VNKPRRSRLAALIAAAATLIAIAGPAGAADDAMVRVLHGSPDAPSVDVFVNDAKVDALSGAEFGDITSYVAVPGGTYSIKVCATADNSVCPIGPVDLTFAAGQKYTIAASDLLASIDANVFEDDAAPTASKASVRVVHLSADTPAVDVLTQAGSATVVDNLAYPDATGYLSLEPGSYDLKVCANADNSVCPLDPGALDLAAGTAYSVFAIGSLSADPSSLTAVVAVDAIAAPNTATVPETMQGTPSALPMLTLLIAAGLLSLMVALRFSTRRIER
jgi:hypothetical protein